MYLRWIYCVWGDGGEGAEFKCRTNELVSIFRNVVVFRDIEFLRLEEDKPNVFGVFVKGWVP